MLFFDIEECAFGYSIASSPCAILKPEVNISFQTKIRQKKIHHVNSFVMQKKTTTTAHLFVFVFFALYSLYKMNKRFVSPVGLNCYLDIDIDRFVSQA